MVLFWLISPLISDYFATSIQGWNTYDIRNLSLAAAGVLSIPFIVVQTATSFSQYQSEKRKRVSDRIGEAAGQLSAFSVVPRFERSQDDESKWETWEKEVVDIGVRHAALLSLVSLAKESPDDRDSIHKIVCEYISRRSIEHNRLMTTTVNQIPWRDNSTKQRNTNFSPSNLPPPDVDVAITVLGRINKMIGRNVINSGYSAEIRGAMLPSAQFRNFQFNWIDFTDSNLMFADLRYAKLEECYLENVNLYGAKFEQTSLNGCVVLGANMAGIDNLSFEDLKLTYGVNFPGSEFHTILPAHLESERDKHLGHWFTASENDTLTDVEFDRKFRESLASWQMANTSALSWQRMLAKMGQFKLMSL